MKKMTTWIRQQLERDHVFAQMMRYLLVGGSAATLELIVFLLLVDANFWYLTANVIALACAATYGFFLQKWWTFKSAERAHGRQAVKFAIVIAIGFLLNNFLIYLFLDVAGWHPFIAKFTQLWLVLAWNYSGQRFWAFRNITTSGSVR